MYPDGAPTATLLTLGTVLNTYIVVCEVVGEHRSKLDLFFCFSYID